MNFKKLFPVKRKFIYLNCASIGPLSFPAYESIKKCLEIFLYKGRLDYFEDLIKVREELRKNISKLIGCKKEEIAFIKNTSHGILLSLLSLPEKKNGNIIIQKDAFPAIKVPAIYSGHKVIYCDFEKDPLKELKKKINRNTVCVIIDWVHFYKGYINDLKIIGDFLKERDIFFIVDGIQGIGAVPINLKELNVDFLSSHSAKWLLGPQGIGFLYLNRETLPKLKKKYAGWISLDWKDFSDFDNFPPLRKGAQIFEEGSYNSPGIFGLNENIKLILNFGKYNVNRKIKRLKLKLRKELEEMGFKILPKEENYKYISGIISFKGNNTLKLFEFLMKNKIYISFRNGFIRVSPHFFNDEEEIEFLIKKIKEFYATKN